MSVPFTDAPLNCNLDAHEWISSMNDEGDYYEVCAGCGKQTAWTPLWPADAG